MSITITRENFTAALEAVVAERGEDFVYPVKWREEPPIGMSPEEGRCKYTVTNEDGERVGACIVGAALEHLLGHPYEGPNDSAFHLLIDGFNVEDEEFANAVAEAQAKQDGGGTWGQALAVYKRFL